MKYIILSLILITAFSSLQAVTWTKVYGTTDYNVAHVAKQTPDGGYIVLGHTGLYTNQEVCLLKLDEYGDSIWSKEFDSVYVGSVDIEVDKDSGFVLAINKEDDYEYNLRIVKTDKFGNIIWEKVYNIGYDYSRDYPLDLDITSDGNYIIVGNTQGGNDAQFILKINTTGDSLWITYFAEENYLSSVCETPVGDFIATNRCSIPYLQNTLLKYDSEGAVIGSVYYDDSYANDIEMLNDSNYIVVTGSHLFKIDEELDSIWSRNIGGWEVEPCNDGGFVITGSATEDAYLNKFNINGDSLWSVFYGGSGDDAFNSISRTSDGGYICCGHTDSWGAGGYDYYIVKTDSLGFALGIEEQVINPNPENFNISYISNQNGNVQFNFTLTQPDNIKLEIFDLSGRLLLTPVSDNFSEGLHEVNIILPHNGVYIYRFTSSHHEQSGSPANHGRLPATMAGKILVFYFFLI